MKIPNFLKRFLFCGFLLILAEAGRPARAESSPIIHAHGSVSVALAVVEAAKVLRKENNIEIALGTLGGSPAGIKKLGSRSVEVALSTRRVTAEDRAAAPDMLFNEIKIGSQPMAMVVSRDVWEGGVHALSRDQVRDIYEGKITNWKSLGGPDISVKMFMSEPGRGLWEMFAEWLYGEVRKAPMKTYATLATYKDLENALEFTPGSIADLPPSCADDRSSYALAIRDEAGHTVEPNEKNFVNGTYPLCRDLLIIVNDRPTLNLKVFVDFMLSDRGQQILKDASLEPLKKSGK